MTGGEILFGLVLLVAIAVALTFYAAQESKESAERRIAAEKKSKESSQAALPPLSPQPVPGDRIRDAPQRVHAVIVQMPMAPIVGAIVIGNLLTALIVALLWAFVH